MNLIKWGRFKDLENISSRLNLEKAFFCVAGAQLFSLTTSYVRIKHLFTGCLLLSLVLATPLAAQAEPPAAHSASAALAVPTTPVAPTALTALAVPTTPVAPVAPVVLTNTSTLRVVCEKDGAGAEVTVNGISKGKCPVTIKVPHGTLKLRVMKKIDGLHEQVFEKNINIGSGESKKVTAILSAPSLKLAKKKRVKPVAVKRSKVVKHKPTINRAKAAKRVADDKAKAAKLQIAEARKRAKLSPALASGLAGDVAPVVPTIRDCAGCPEMVVIPPGEFTMGSPSFEARRQNVEDPVHYVAISSAFAMGKTEVTRGQFAAFVNEMHFNTGDKCWTFEDSKYEERSARSWRNPGYKQDDSHPVACVNWMDAKAYTEWLSRKTGKQYRMPSEAEWEYAARGNTKRVPYLKNNPDKVCGSANVMDATGKKEVPGVTWEAHNCDDGYAYTSPAGSFSKNAFGLYDMIGNLWEWVEDSDHNDYKGAPADGSAWQGDGGIRLLRGGSWSDDAQGARAAARGKGKPDLRNSTIGFRVVRIMP